MGGWPAQPVLVWVLALFSRQPLWPRRTDLPRFAAFGLITALHFLSYIASLNFTTIAHSLAIVYTAPVFVALFSAWLLKEPIARRKWLGIAVTVAGIAVLAGLEARMNARMLLGDSLALVSAITFGLYSVAGRSQRERYGLFTYAGTVYGLAALWALPAAALSFSAGRVPGGAAVIVARRGPHPARDRTYIIQRGVAAHACDDGQSDRHPGGHGGCAAGSHFREPDSGAERNCRGSDCPGGDWYGVDVVKWC